MTSPAHLESRAAGPAPHPILDRYHADEAHRRKSVRSWFDEAASEYDWVSQLLSFGTGNRYRRDVLERAGVAPGVKLLDVACGTGLLAAGARSLGGASCPASALDASLGMLQQARQRGLKRLVHGLAEALPYPDGSFEVLSMGYALRHVSSLVVAFREYRRVLQPGGKVLILEITPPRRGVAKWLLKLHFRYLIPLIARIVSRRRGVQEVFEYYWDTMEHCVPPEEILAALREAGFSDARREVDLGIFSTYVATA